LKHLQGDCPRKNRNPVRLSQGLVPKGPVPPFAFKVLRGGPERLNGLSGFTQEGNQKLGRRGVETFPNGAVAAYSLGNFVFDQEWSDGRQFPIQGIMLRATFRGARLGEVELIPIHIYDNFQPRLAPPDEAKVILAQVEASLAEMPKR